jgi:Zn-dependent protease with chaperone function
MGQLLLAIAQGEEKTAAGTGKPPDATKAPQPGAERARRVWSWLSSHPDTVERATELERGHAPHCAAP